MTDTGPAELETPLASNKLAESNCKSLRLGGCVQRFTCLVRREYVRWNG